MDFLWESYWQLVEDRNCDQILPVHAYMYIKCERGKDPKIAIFVCISYELLVGNQSRSKIVAAIFSYMPIRRMRA